jgi:uncharacterized membrane protein HdeD (DUF308 family)
MTEHPLRHAPTASVGGDTISGSAEERLAVPFWQVMVLGLTTTLFGIAVLVWPAETLRTLGVLVGIWLMILGVTRILGAFSSKQGVGRQVLSGTVGVVLLIGGAACLRNVAKGVLVLAFLIALVWILSGVAEFAIAFQTTGATRRWLVILALVSIAIGIVFLLWPTLSLTTIVLLTGISGLIVGVGEIAFALQLRRGAPS